MLTQLLQALLRRYADSEAEASTSRVRNLLHKALRLIGLPEVRA
jgi:hypothetical protein